jgi:hypothetical protein
MIAAPAKMLKGEPELIMTRIEVIALFSALAKLCEKNDLESVTEVVKEVLQEARRDDKSEK